MSLSAFWEALENLPLAMSIGEGRWFPLLESLHVLAAVSVVGSLLMVDLRLLYAAARDYSVSALSRDFLRWTWAAFVMATCTGALLFITRASHHVHNVAFLAKLALLGLAGVNMLVFQLGAWRRVAAWNMGPPPRSARIAGAMSLALWSGVVLAGRWMGHLSY